MSRLKRLLQEVHKRSLWQLLASYIVGAWLVLQIAETLASLIGLPLWFGAGVIALLAFGLVLVLATGLVQVVAAYRSDPDRSYSGVRWLFSWKNTVITGLIAVMVLLVGTAGYMGLRAMGIGPMGSLVAKGVLEPGERIVLADFENLTRDSLYGVVVTEALRTNLADSRLLRVAEPEYLRGAMARMEKDPDAFLDETLAREVAIREGLRAVIVGQVASLGTGYMLSARMVVPESGEAVAGWSETASDPMELIPAIDRLAKGIRERSGESLRAIRRSEPLEQVTTGSLEALKKYTKGVRLNTSGRRDRAISFLEEAIALDSTFASAYRKLGALYSNAGRRAESMEATRRAYEWRDRITEAERYNVIAYYHMAVTGDVDQAIDAYSTLVEISDSTHVAALHNLAILYSHVRDYERAERLYQRALLERDSLSRDTFRNLSRVQVRLGQLDEARVTLERAGERMPSTYWHYEMLADLAAYRGEYATAEEHILARGEAGDTPDERLDSQAFASFMRANLAVLQGRLGEGRRHYRADMSTEERRGNTLGLVYTAARLALLDVSFLGDSARAIQIMDAVLEQHPISELEPLERPYRFMALFYALAGQPERARAMFNEYETTNEPALSGYTQRPAYHLTEGAVVLAEGRYQEAIPLLRLGNEGPYYVRGLHLLGRAYDLNGQADSAIAIYERYITYPETGRTLYPVLGRANDPFWLPLIYERLADLYEQRGDTLKAIQYYGKLVDLWKDADPELQPRVEAARRAIEALSTDR